MSHIRLLIRGIISEAVAAAEKTYSIKINSVNGNYILYKSFIDDSDFYEPVKKTVKVMDLGKDPENAKKKAFQLTKRNLEVPNSNVVKKNALGNTDISIGKYKNEKLSNIPIYYLFELLFFSPKFKFKSSLKYSDEYQKVYSYLTEERASELNDFLISYVNSANEFNLLRLYNNIHPNSEMGIVFGETLKPLIQDRLINEFSMAFDDDGNIIIDSSEVDYGVGKKYIKTVDFFSSMPSKNNPGDYVWFFIDDNGNLIKFLEDKNFESSSKRHKIKFKVSSTSPIKGKKTFLISSELESIQPA
jgi:hypothetical protein